MAEHTIPDILEAPQNRWKFILSELKPKKSIWTIFNMISVPTVAVAAVIIVYRFIFGLAAVSNVTQSVPWGLWKGFNVVTGVAFAGGAYVLTFMVYILGLEKYKPLVRVTVLNGFLAYTFYAFALILDLGKPWNIINPVIGNSFGTSSVLFLVAWHFILYIVAQMIEFSPAVAEWLGSERARKILKRMTVGAVIFGITLSTLHQSGLGALFLMAKGKIHPLWYSEFIPTLFFISSIFAGLSVVIFQGSIIQRVFAYQMEDGSEERQNVMIRGLAKVCAMAMFVYLFLKVVDMVHNHTLGYLTTPMGAWYLLEVVGFVFIPMVMFVRGVRIGTPGLIKLASLLTMIGIVLNRMNISVIAYRWDQLPRYIPSWMEFVVTISILFVQVWIYRWVIHRMPVLRTMESMTQSKNA
ncbi:MAG: polysulfide reductase NrfD [Candidatus Marinimicrobia bacterium]|nr:polysulfide reductase NrfD [Candidatus Neomarinimicrobiota bacterium]MCF7851373.1 polysulfide reductase NrfD [Candidatus Neomarinimicrobiota bacterium]MCF7904207.1 polysulfide reductase NrfD [Candidatus Neomarinimicrobiota bacterium]